jgi:diguanylate cyclase (GGDEF)-like protein
LHHKDGHRIPVFVQVSPITDNKGEVIGAVEVFSDTSARGYFLERVAALQDQALLDPISGIPNRNFLEKKIATRLWEMRQFDWQFGIIAIKIDCIEGLKDNGKDCYGDAIKLFAQTLIGNISPFDWIGRWIDPEEKEDRAHFVAIIQNTSVEKLEELAIIFTTLLQKTDLAPIDKDAKISASSGIALAQENDTPESLINRAREAH